MISLVESLLQSFQELLVTNHSTSVVLTDKHGRHRIAPVYSDELSRLVFERTGHLCDVTSAAKPVLMDCTVPGLQYTAVSLPASAHDVYVLRCGVLAAEESMPAIEAYIKANPGDTDEWLQALSHAKIWTTEEIRRLLDGMERFAKLFSYLLTSGHHVFLYENLIKLLLEAAAPPFSKVDRIVDSLVKLFGNIDFAGYAIRAEHDRYNIVEYSGPNREEWMNASFSYGEGYLGQVCLLGQPRDWMIVEADPRSAFFHEKGLQPGHIFGYPIVVDSETSAVLFGGSFAKQDFGKDLESTLNIVSYVLGMQLQLKNLKKKEFNYSTQLAALVEISKIMNTATELKKALYVFVDVSLILLSQASSCHLLIQIPGTSKAQIVSRGMKQEQVQSYSKTIIETYIAPANGITLQEPLLTTCEDGECMLVCPIFVQSNLCGILSVKIPYAAVYEECKDTFSTFVFLSGITLERILASSGKEELRRKAKLLHEAVKVWNREAYEKAVRAQELTLEFAGHLDLPQPEKDQLAAASLLCVYPGSCLREQLAGDTLLSVIEGYFSLKDKSRSGPVLSAPSYPVSCQILLLAYTYLEHNEQIAPIHELIGVEEPLRSNFITFVMKKFTVDFEMAVDQQVMPSELIDFQQIKLRMNISSREQDVLRLILNGLNNREIAEELFISEHTVKNHITNIFQKLEVSDRAQAIARVYNLGYQQ